MPPASRKKMALLEGLDQYSAYYSVICVFGSVVGCVVVPLITQSIEGIILSAIVISLTAKTIHSRSFTFRDEPIDDRSRRGSKESNIHDKRTKKKKIQSSSNKVVDNEVVRRQRQEDMIKIQEQRNLEKQHKFEEKKLKKARKREEKLKQREEEEREREKEAQQKREREEKKFQQKQKKLPAGVACLDSIDSLTRPPLPPPRERKNSSSSSGSSRSSRSLPRPRPPRMTPRGNFSRASSDSNIPTPSPPTPELPPHLQIPDLPAHLDTLNQPKQSSTTQQTTGHKQPKVDQPGTVSLPNTNQPPATNSRNVPSPPRQVFAVNPLAPSKAVTMVITPQAPPGIISTVPGGGAVKVGYNWNAQLYYWSLAQAGLTRPIQYGWDPVAPPHNYISGPALGGDNLQLQVTPNSNLWGSRGSLSAPSSTNTTATSSPPPSTSSFGVIGKLSTQATPTDSLPRQPPKECLSKKETDDDNSRGYSLFSSDGGQTIFGKSLLNNGQASGTQLSKDTTGNDDNCPLSEGASPRKARFDEWPAL